MTHEPIITYEPKHWDNVSPHIASIEQYKQQYQASIENPSEYWASVAKQLSWYRPFDTVYSGSFKEGCVHWFDGGMINASYNCLDRHIATRGDQVAFIWEADAPGQHKYITYKEVLANVCKFANVLTQYGVKKGDRVAIYMPMIPETVYAMLACTRIGAIHSVVFAGFSAESLRARIVDATCRVVLTADFGLRGGRPIALKKTVDQALRDYPGVETVLVMKHPNAPATDLEMLPGRDVWLLEELAKQRPYCPPVPVNADDPMFMLYTSGSTGKPKGIIHSTGGYLVYVGHTCKMVWDLHEGDRMACVADVGWITGHSYVVYGPLLNGTTSVLFESVPTYPNPSRYWQMIQEHKVTQFYTAPTAIRTLMAFGNKHLEGYDLSSVRILGSVGEPINPEAWRWYYFDVGKEKAAVVDTYFQTETAGIIVTPLPSAIPTKPGSATFPFFGMVPKVLDPKTAEVIEGPGEGILVFEQPWPSLTTTIYGDHPRYVSTYLEPYPGYYFTGDGVRRDEDGYIWITGRVDDVINKCGHRLGTAEIESALVLHHLCAEAAVVAIPDDVRGQAIVAFCILNQYQDESPEVINSLKQQVRDQIGGLAVPDYIIVLPGLPKTRSGKIMRRILRKVSENDTEHLGDISTLSETDVVPILIAKVKQIIYPPEEEKKD